MPLRLIFKRDSVFWPIIAIGIAVGIILGLHLVRSEGLSVCEDRGLKVYVMNNPFTIEEGTAFFFEISEGGIANLKIYDLAGDTVRTLIDGESCAVGLYRIRWNGKNDFGNFINSGIYIYKLEMLYGSGGYEYKIAPLGATG